MKRKCAHGSGLESLKTMDKKMGGSIVHDKAAPEAPPSTHRGTGFAGPQVWSPSGEDAQRRQGGITS